MGILFLLEAAALLATFVFRSTSFVSQPQQIKKPLVSFSGFLD
ncbi:hypothetical protein VCB_001610 [Vibrio cholerae TMA 21]|nr:hypothetical protein VCB_001610 [Vibrio cholerae TMA 21]